MKRIITFFAAVLFTATSLMAQSPEKMSYQAIVRDANNDLIKDTQIGMQISILQSTTDGTAVYVETQTPTTNANGLATVEIGSGTVVSGDFSVIDWSAGPFFIKIETDIENDGTYDIAATSQLLSVPYALYAKTAGDVTETDLGDVLTNGNDGNGSQIKNIADPTDAQDVATKAYVDEVRQMILKMQADEGVTDFDGNHYPAVVIGNQIWMAQNLYVTHYADGTEIPLVTDNTEWSNLASTDPAFTFYGNDAANAKEWGGYYTWGAATRGETSNTNPSHVQGACPDGWHLPSDAEWQEMEYYLGMSAADTSKMGNDLQRGTDEGGKLKTVGTTYFNSPNTGATNETGFSAIGTGLVTTSGGFDNHMSYTYFWTTTPSGNDFMIRRLMYGVAYIERKPYVGQAGLQVRCVKD